MKVKIIKATPDKWYYSSIGKWFDVMKLENESGWWVVNKNQPANPTKMILTEDAEEVFDLDVEGLTIKFKKGNEIPYGQDFGFHKGIPHDVEFTVHNFNVDKIKLIGHGYGATGSYGNGALFVGLKDLVNYLEKEDYEVVNDDHLLKDIGQIPLTIVPELRKELELYKKALELSCTQIAACKSSLYDPDYWIEYAKKCLKEPKLRICHFCKQNVPCLVEHEDINRWKVYCSACGGGTGMYGTKEEAVNVWNGEVE